MDLSLVTPTTCGVVGNTYCLAWCHYNYPTNLQLLGVQVWALGSFGIRVYSFGFRVEVSGSGLVLV